MVRLYRRASKPIIDNAKTAFFLAASLLRAKKLELFQEDKRFLKYCIVFYLCAADDGDVYEADGCDLCEADDDELATANSRMPQLPPRFSEAFPPAKTSIVHALSLLKVKSSKISALSL